MNFKKLLLEWYGEHHRPLPWRQTNDPYAVWLSEIILQQTRVEQGRSYYYHFLETYPDIFALARAPLDQVLKSWQGLGYYSRARNLHQTAGIIAEELNGKFPDSYEGLLKLKGIGEYTAAAIASFCYGIAEPVLDGNVYRVTSRLLADSTPINIPGSRKHYTALLRKMIFEDEPGLFNQAMMELGATVCKPRNPECSNCPLSEHCKSFQQGNPTDYPVKLAKKKPEDLYLNFYVLVADGKVLLTQRDHSSIWPGLHEFPSQQVSQITGAPDPSFVADFLKNPEQVRLRSTEQIRHQLTHRSITATFFLLDAGKAGFRGNLQRSDIFEVPLAELQRYALHKLMEKYLKTSKLADHDQQGNSARTTGKRP